MQVSMILPAYNEAAKIEETVDLTVKALKKITSSFEIIIAEDGSTDGTDEIVSNLAEKYRYIKHLHSSSRLGKGGALNMAFKSASGEVLCFIDTDLATDMSHLKELIESISTEGYDVAIGSRMMPQSKVRRKIERSVVSHGFNFLVRTLLKSKLHDHQCGFKAFRREPLLNLIDNVKDKNWFWDTEVLLLAQKYGYEVKEFPVQWNDGGPTRVNIRKAVLEMGSQIIRLKCDFNKEKRNKVLYTIEHKKSESKEEGTQLKDQG